MRGWGRVVERVAWAIAAVWVVVTLAFAIDSVLPSDPARMVAGPQARAADVARIRTQLGLDRPLPVRYGLYLRRLVHLGDGGDPKAHATCATFGPIHIDLGRSYVQRRAVVAVIGDRLPRSAWLALAAILVQTAIGVVLGTFAAARAGTRWDRGTVAVTLAVASVPTFLLGLGLQYVLAVRLGWLPLDGFGVTFAEHAASMVLPALALGLSGAAFATRLTRDEVSHALREDFARTARAKGSSRARVAVVHALRTALTPLATAAALDFGTLVGGAIVVESLFRWPGLGAASVTAMLDRDGPVVIGTVIVTSTAVVLSSLVVDLAYAWLDPRLRR